MRRRVDPEDVVQSEFPELGTVADCPIELVREEMQVRRYHGTAPTLDELAGRFPSRVREIESATNSAPAASVERVRRDVPERLGRYELRELLGQGTFSTVHRAWDPELRRDVAIKVTRPELMTDTGSRGRVLREAQSAARLRHPAIVPIHEVGQDGEQTFIVYEYVPGPTLAALLREATPTPRHAAKWVARVAEALEYAHGCGIVHRDVKPANVMMVRSDRIHAGASEDHRDESGHYEPILADFGLALQADAAATLTQQGDVLGTPAYMSPEQARGDGHRVDARTDVYSLGVVLFELLTGQLPFRGSGASVLHRVIHDEPPVPSQLRVGVPGDLETICLKAMAKEPARRYRTAGAMADDLRRFLEHRPILARRVGVTGRSTTANRAKPASACCGSHEVWSLRRATRRIFSGPSARTSPRGSTN